MLGVAGRFEIMTWSGTLRAPLIDLERPDETEWDCRGFDTPLPQGVQHVHDGNFQLVSPAPSNSIPTSKPRPETVAKRRRALLAIVCCTTVMLIEFGGGLAAHSLALVTDATHMLADVASYCIVLVSLGTASKGPSARASFGLLRAEVLCGLGSLLLIWATAGVLLYEAAWRMYDLASSDNKPRTDGPTMLGVAALGLASNLGLLLLFRGSGDKGDDSHGHSHGGGDMSTRAALVHVAGDVAQSGGVLIAAALITFDGQRWVWLDPVVTAAAAVWMLSGTLGLFREAYTVLMEASPPDIDTNELRRVLSRRADVTSIHCFHLWALAPGKLTLTAHVLCAPSCEDTDEVLEDLCKVCQYKFGIHHVTFQVTQDRRLVGNGGRPCGH